MTNKIEESVISEFIRGYFLDNPQPEDLTPVRAWISDYLLDCWGSLDRVNISTLAGALWKYRNGDPGAMFQMGFTREQSEVFSDAAATLEAKYYGEGI